MVPPVFKTGLASNTVAGGFDSLPPPPHASGERVRDRVNDSATSVWLCDWFGRELFLSLQNTRTQRLRCEIPQRPRQLEDLN